MKKFYLNIFIILIALFAAEQIRSQEKQTAEASKNASKTKQTTVWKVYVTDPYASKDKEKTSPEAKKSAAVKKTASAKFTQTSAKTADKKTLAKTFDDKKDSDLNTSPARNSAYGEGKRWMFYLTFSGAYYSNINHDETDIDDYGIVPGAGVYFRNRPNNPNFEFRYEIGQHAYRKTDRWDRTSHSLQIKSENEISNKWISETEGEITLKGSNEDRELTNRYSLTQFFQYRWTRSDRFNFGGSYRLKRGYDDPLRNSVNPYLEASYERRFSGGRNFEVSYRYDWNRAGLERFDYIRWTYGATFETPLFSGGRFRAEARFRPKKYKRLIDLELPDGDEIEVPRFDKTWIFSAQWRRPISRNLELGLFYKYEQRNSNDFDKNFKSNAAGISLTYFWWR